MLYLGPLGFTAPWLLVAALALPLLWLILRALPPAPRRIVFPAAGLLAGLRDARQQARRTPWWLMLLRCLALAALIAALAGPVWRPSAAVPQDGPLLVVLDAGWSAAPGWDGARARAVRELRQAEAAGRPVALLLGDGRAGLRSDAVALAEAAQPAAWQTGYAHDALQDAPDRLTTLWLSDGLDHPGRAALLSALSARGVVTVVSQTVPVHALELTSDETPALRLFSTTPEAPEVEAIGPDPQGIPRVLARLTTGAATTRAGITRRDIPIDLPPELRNRVTRFAVAGTASAGAVLLTDDRTARRKVALVGDDRMTEAQALLSPLHYLRQALTGVDLIEGGLADVLQAAPDVIVLVDQSAAPEAAALSQWVTGGGLLIRFAGPALASDPALVGEPLLPIVPRPGGREIGGALSWGDPRGLLPFAADGPFAGLVPPDEVTVRAQLMAQPMPDLAAKTLAALADQTPLVTRASVGDGQVVLFHVTANADWSGLPVSGLFPQMLARLVALARQPLAEAPAADQPATHWQAVQVLDGFGRAGDPQGLAPVPQPDLADGPAPGRPAGIYTAGERRRALNAGAALTLADWPGATVEAAHAAAGLSLRPFLLMLAGLALLADVLASAALVRGGRKGGRVAALVLLTGLSLLAVPSAPMAQEVPDNPEPKLVAAAAQIALAYVETGDEALDQTSYQGLAGLSRVLSLRSSVEPGEPVAIDLDQDDLSLLTLLYWPVTEDQPLPTPEAYLRLNRFLRRGGVILFDTRDGDLAGIGGPDRAAALQRLAAPLEIPPLAPVPRDHVLTRSFYLLDAFPGRYDSGQLWAEAASESAASAEGVPFRNLNDGVSPVLIGGNDWAAAWAIDDRNLPVFPVGRGFDGERQREIAYRFGVNLVMYVLTGNYKSDQVHVPALLERLRSEDAGVTDAGPGVDIGPGDQPLTGGNPLLQQLVPGLD
ncbi:MAG: DUF4159 domain-containing protein [Paracoccus sp. (in: a-proteobacteria)]|uniref:DUF4159 domain-containing protein n=1 Tax=Paracoccus sp. TaxID=267 RepID=UPI0026DF8A40|nr:DUF4159 domain-containing protein [Paracoccus sp. (in: a-proteobacteria)]MDO5620417.1 DUF4159 domain-containing protein [Paracoccus sp. (in: a-proteobacteria)]